MTLVKLEPVASPSRVKLSTTEPLCPPPPILLLQRRRQALPNARVGVEVYKVSNLLQVPKL